MNCKKLILVLAFLACGCNTYKGGKVVEGANLEIGMTIPGTQWSINFLSATSGLNVGANVDCALSVTNEVAETNRYFGVVEMCRYSKTSAIVEPYDISSSTNSINSITTDTKE